MFLYSVSDK